MLTLRSLDIDNYRTIETHLLDFIEPPAEQNVLLKIMNRSDKELRS